METRTLGIVTSSSWSVVAACWRSRRLAHAARRASFEGQFIAASDFKVADYAGKPLVINYFGSWCGPCNMEAPELATFAKAQPGGPDHGHRLTGHAEGRVASSWTSTGSPTRWSWTTAA